jgi:hypothetical protein
MKYSLIAKSLRSRGRSLVLLIACLLGLFQTCSAIGPGDSIVVLIVTFPDGSSEIGTGAFVDHDGLILTADHVIHRTAYPPPSIVDKTIPAQTAPSQILVYSSLLRTRLKVDLSRSDTVVGGVVSPNLWIDGALVRVSLTDAQRAAIQPLDLLSQTPAQDEALTAWGPSWDRDQCSDLNDTGCLSPESTGTRLSNKPTDRRDYIVRANLKKGYSGGPLTNASFSIVGIGSWGTRMDGSGNQGSQIFDATYVPSYYLIFYLLSHVPPSAWLSNPQGCTNTSSLSYLTVFDMEELFPPGIQQKPTLHDCQCCCDSMLRAPSSLNLTIARMQCTQQINTDCTGQKILALSNNIQLAVLTSNVSDATADQYSQLRQSIASIDRKNYSTNSRARLYDSFASTSALLATSNQANREPFKTASNDALFAIKQRIEIGATASSYSTMSSVYSQLGDPANATAASKMASVVGQPKSAQKSVNINQNALKKQLLRNIPTNMGVAGTASLGVK